MNVDFLVKCRLCSYLRWSWLGHKWHRIIIRLALKFLIPAGNEDLILLVDVLKHAHLTVPQFSLNTHPTIIATRASLVLT
jgi:hypothetical protein